MSGEKIVKIRFERDTSYRRVHANSFWGGVNSHGELEFDICEDIAESVQEIRLIYPEVEGTQVKEERLPSSMENETRIRRIQHMGVVMPIAVVAGIIKWLQEKVSVMEE